MPSREPHTHGKTFSSFLLPFRFHTVPENPGSLAPGSNDFSDRCFQTVSLSLIFPLLLLCLPVSPFPCMSPLFYAASLPYVCPLGLAGWVSTCAHVQLSLCFTLCPSGLTSFRPLVLAPLPYPGWHVQVWVSSSPGDPCPTTRTPAMLSGV